MPLSVLGGYLLDFDNGPVSAWLLGDQHMTRSCTFLVKGHIGVKKTSIIRKANPQIKIETDFPMVTHQSMIYLERCMRKATA